MAEIRLALAKEEAEFLDRGETRPHKLSPAAFVQLGLDLEDQQSVTPSQLCKRYSLVFRRTLRMKLKASETTYEQADTQDKRNALRRRIESWLVIRKSYILPLVDDPDHFDTNDGAPFIHSKRPETVLLRLPSTIPPSTRLSLCLFETSAIETRLRTAQAYDSLSDLRRQLRIKSGLFLNKKKNIGPGQRINTRYREVIRRFDDKIDRTVARYRAAHSALQTLDPGGSWRSDLHDLLENDIKGPTREEGEAEGTRQLSWIWIAERRSKSTEREWARITTRSINNEPSLETIDESTCLKPLDFSFVNTKYN
jgi:hypothetical protein